MSSVILMRALVCTFLCVAVSLAQSARDPGAAKNPLAGKADAIAAGQKLFREGCAACHGANAEGGRGPNLNENRDLRRMTDAQLFATIRHGIPGTEMPASPLPDTNIWQIAAFVRSLSAPAYFTPVQGDPRAGEQLFFGKAQCSSCHMVRGKGGYIGPDLTNVAAQSTARQLRESILKPNARIDPAFVGVVVRLKNGTRLEGVAKNHSNYSVQLLDADGKLHLLSTRDIQSIDFRKKSLMPDDYGKRLSLEELTNILAFLSRQAIMPMTPSESERESPEIH